MVVLWVPIEQTFREFKAFWNLEDLARDTFHIYVWVFPKIGVPQNGWFVMENPIKMDDLGGTIIFGNTRIIAKHSKLCML